MTTPGDTPFDVDEYAFTVAEAAKVSQVSESDIRNWMRRGVVPVGKKAGWAVSCSPPWTLFGFG